MENFKLKILDSIGKIYEESKRCKLEKAFFNKMNAELTFLSEYFGITKSQSLFISLVFTMNYKGDSVDYNDLVRHFDCNPLKILEYSDDFTNLCAKGILRKQKSRFKFKLAGANSMFTIHEKISEAIMNNEPMPEIQDKIITDVLQVLEELYNLSQQCYEDDISTKELFVQARKLIISNLHFPLIRNVNHFELELEDAFLYFYIIWMTLTGNKTTSLGRTLEVIYDTELKRINYMQKLISGENILLKYNYIELVETQFFNNCEMKLTDNSINLLAECGLNLFKNTKKKKDNILSPNQIPNRELIFCESEMKQLYMLKDLLSDEKFKEAQKRLTSKNLPKGLTVLFHGVPGTGKTEIVKQLSRETNRELMKVEISQSKSKWFGESQKIIKQIFTDYKEFAKECEQTPILLINEADALLSKRKSIEDSNVGQTENSIQNILLEELENFEGILIATTNLTNNLDSAFERRFLFKIQFKKPDSSIRARIWKSKLPLLEMEDCKVLAEKFNFSGGQIDNVLRKNEIHEIIHGEQVSLENLMAFCSEETLTNEITKVGFSKS